MSTVSTAPPRCLSHSRPLARCAGCVRRAVWVARQIASAAAPAATFT